MKDLRKKIVSAVLSAAMLLGLSGTTFAAKYKGDSNGDGKVRSSDALAVLKWTIGTGKIDKTVSDFNGDGKVNSKDALEILRFCTSGEKPIEIGGNDPADTTDNIDFKDKYYYSTLDAKGKKIYENIVTAIENFEKGAYCPGLDYKDNFEDNFAMVSTIYGLVKYENPQLFQVGNQRGWSSDGTVMLFYTLTKKQTENIRSKLEAKADAILEKAKKAPNKKECARIIHDEIINMTRYRVDTNDRSNSEPDGPLLNGYARCEGYSRAFAYVAQRAGIETICVSGPDHMWNMIKLDGKWVHVDVTFDDPIGSGDYLRYDYFCVDDSVLAAENRMVDDGIAFPTKLKVSKGY